MRRQGAQLHKGLHGCALIVIRRCCLAHPQCTEDLEATSYLT